MCINTSTSLLKGINSSMGSVQILGYFNVNVKFDAYL